MGIGANTAIFSLLDATLLRPLPVENPKNLAWVHVAPRAGPSELLSFPEYRDLRGQATVFDGLIAQDRRGAALNLAGETELLLMTIVSDNYFAVLGVRPERGRLFDSQGDRVAAADSGAAGSAAPPIVISHGLWQRRFGADPALIGKPIVLNGSNLTVIGILPASFPGLMRGLVNDVWMPYSTFAAVGNNRVEMERRTSRQFEAIARLKAGVSPQQAQAQLDTLGKRMQDTYPESNQGKTFTLETVAGREAHQLPATLLVMAPISMVLLIVCANVATLFVVQAEARRHEIAMRQALGASRGRLLRQLLTEGAALAALGAALGVLLALWLIRAAPALLPPSPIPLDLGARMDARVLLYALGLTIATTILFALAPAWRASRPDLAAVLRGESPPRGPFRLSGRNLLAAAQVALSVTLLAEAGLLLRNYQVMQNTSPGFDTGKQILAVQLDASRNAFQEMAARLRGLPGVKQVALARRLPMAPSGGGATLPVIVPGYKLPSGQESLEIHYNQVGPGYFSTIGTHILRGRDLDDRDSTSAPKVVLISDSMARLFWPGQDSVGRSIRVGTVDRQIVGVAEDARINRLHETPEPFLYLPLSQMPVGEATLLVETAGEPASMTGLVKQEIAAVDRRAQVLTVVTMRGHMQTVLYADWIPAVIATATALLGLALAALGLYGTVAYLVSRRTREFGVRVAMGARGRDVVRLVLRQGLGLAMAGVVVGSAGAVAATRLTVGQIPSVVPADATTYALAALLGMLVALAASFIPAHRASRVEPMVALRYE